MAATNSTTRRNFLAAAGTLLSTGYASQVIADESDSLHNEAIAIRDRRELFVDSYLIHGLRGAAQQKLHHPIPDDLVLVHDAPWEGTGSGYHSVFHDGERYRMYYKAWHLDLTSGKLNTTRHPLYCCYAESSDGISWHKPNLGLHNFAGSTANNITIVSGRHGPLNVDAGHPAVFLDDRPDAAPEARFKAILRSRKPNGLLPFRSADGFHWEPMTNAPILHDQGAFDSQNLAFWDSHTGQYRAYWRTFTDGVTDDTRWQPSGLRAIRTSTSDDLISWAPPIDLTYDGSPPEQLYTNQVKPYHRAPHLLIGFPTRYIDRGWSPSMRALPAEDRRKLRSAASPRYGTALTDALFMTSRNGTDFHRWNEAFLRPGPERPGTWNYGHQYIGWHVVETRSSQTGAANELSLYATESYWHGKGSAVRRYTLRLDGFVSVHGPAAEDSELITKVMTFEGAQMHLNFSTSAAGAIRVEVQRPDGVALKNYSLDDFDELFGDSTDRVVSWRGRSDLSPILGRPVRLRIQLRDADLYSLQFHS